MSACEMPLASEPRRATCFVQATAAAAALQSRPVGLRATGPSAMPVLSTPRPEPGRRATPTRPAPPSPPCAGEGGYEASAARPRVRADVPRPARSADRRAAAREMSRTQQIRRDRGGRSSPPGPSGLPASPTAETTVAPRNRTDAPSCEGRGARARERDRGVDEDGATWLILPVVICLSQRLSHACVSMN